MTILKLLAIFAAIWLLLMVAVLVVLTINSGKIEKELERQVNENDD